MEIEEKCVFLLKLKTNVMEKVTPSCLTPSNSSIQVYSSPMLVGPVENLKGRCAFEALRYASKATRFILGHVSEKWSRPRFKGYEKHCALNVNKIHILYRCFSKSDAQEMERYLIAKFKAHPRNCNIRCEGSYNGPDKIESYLVYLCEE